jgi:hypothetical protein
MGNNQDKPLKGKQRSILNTLIQTNLLVMRTREDTRYTRIVTDYLLLFALSLFKSYTSALHFVRCLPGCITDASVWLGTVA